MSQTIDGFKITASRTPYRRAGLNLGEPLLIAQDALDKKQLETLRADPIVHIEAVELPAQGDTPAAAESLPTKKADLQAWLNERHVAFEDADTVAQLTDKAKAHQAQQAGE